MHRERRPVREMVLCILLLLALTLVPEVSQAQRRGGRGETSPTLGLEQGTVDLQAPGLQLSLLRASQSCGAAPESAPDFDFTPVGA